MYSIINSPILYKSIFSIALLLPLLLLNLSRLFRCSADGMLIKISETLERRGALISHPETEQKKFAIIRGLLGAILSIRMYWIFYYLSPWEWSNDLIVSLVAVEALFSIFLIVGLFTQWTILYFIFFQWILGEQILGTSTLVHDVAAMLAILLLIAKAGAVYSLDKTIISRYPKATYFLLYGKSSYTSKVDLQIAKLIALSSYWLLCVYSVMMHIGESAWLGGVAGPQLLANNFMSTYFEWFTHIFENSEFAVLLAKISLWGMIPWYFLILPFVLLGGIYRTYIIVWSILFFALSTFFLELSWLGEVEFLLLAGLFWVNTGMNPKSCLAIAYDDRCNLCDKTIRFIQKIDLFNVISYKPVSKNKDWLDTHEISTNEALTDLYGLREAQPETKYAGFDLYLELTRSIILLYPLVPVFYLGKWTGIGPRIYRFIADKRIKIAGECTISTISISEVSLNPLGSNEIYSGGSPLLRAIFIHFVIVSLGYCAWLPFQESLGRPLFSKNDFPGSALYQLRAMAEPYGMQRINVFNKTDLKMSENWFTVEVIKSDARILLPILAKSGQKLDIHKSDIAYFKRTLPFRRRSIGSTGCLYKAFERDIAILTFSIPEVLKNNYKEFIYTQYFQKIADFDLILHSNIYEPNPTKVVCEVRFQI